MRTDRRMVSEVRTNGLDTHGGDIHVTPNVESRDINTDAVLVLARNDAFHGQTGLQIEEDMLLRRLRVEAAVLVSHPLRLLTNARISRAPSCPTPTGARRGGAVH